jgi:hypothetical protein
LQKGSSHVPFLRVKEEEEEEEEEEGGFSRL